MPMHFTKHAQACLAVMSNARLAGMLMLPAKSKSGRTGVSPRMPHLVAQIKLMQFEGQWLTGTAGPADI